jgi:hypothetical protein
VDAQAGQNGRGNQITWSHFSQCGKTNFPAAVASQYGFTSGNTGGAGAGNTFSEIAI